MLGWWKQITKHHILRLTIPITVALWVLLTLVLITPSASAAPSHGATPLKAVTHQKADWTASYNESDQLYCDVTIPICLYAHGVMSFDDCFVTNPPSMCYEYQGIDIQYGAYWGQVPYSSIWVDDDGGNHVAGPINITNYGCAVAGWPTSYTCGTSNRSAYTRYCYPLQIFHEWFAVDDGLTAGAGDWYHTWTC